MAKMRAKVRVGSVIPVCTNDGAVTQERLVMSAVAKSAPYPEGGADEDNSFAKYTPSAIFDIVLANPDLIGKFEPGQTYYVDFTPTGRE